MKTKNEINKKIEDLEIERKNIKQLRPGCDPDDAQNNVYQHKAILNQISALKWALGLSK